MPTTRIISAALVLAGAIGASVLSHQSAKAADLDDYGPAPYAASRERVTTTYRTRTEEVIVRREAESAPVDVLDAYAGPPRPPAPIYYATPGAYGPPPYAVPYVAAPCCGPARRVFVARPYGRRTVTIIEE